MVFYAGITALTIALSYLAGEKKDTTYVECAKQQIRSRYALFTIFVVLFLVASLRYYVGNDYISYVTIFRKLYIGEHVSTEIGFNGIVLFYQMLFGEGTMIPIFATLAAITIYYMLRALCDQMDWFFYGFVLFMLSGYYLTSFNIIRYYVAFAIVMYAAKYVMRREYVPFLLYVGLAATIHKTALIVIPTYWFLARTWSKLEYGVIVVGTISFVLFEDFYRILIFKIYPYYENSIYDTNTTSFFNIAKGIAILIFALCFYRQVQNEERLQFYFKMNIITIVIYATCSFIPVVSRVAYYFVWGQIFLITNLVAKMEPGRWKQLCIVGITMSYLLFFLLFLRNAAGIDMKIIPYQTWIGVDVG